MTAQENADAETPRSAAPSPTALIIALVALLGCIALALALLLWGRGLARRVATLENQSVMAQAADADTASEREQQSRRVAGATELAVEADRKTAAIAEQTAALEARLQFSEAQTRLFADRIGRAERAAAAASSASDPGQADFTAAPPQPPAMSAQERQVAAIPALARVADWNRNWNIVVLDAGELDDLKKGSEYLVRRGGRIVGQLRLDQVLESQSMASYAPRSAAAEDEPRIGDEVIRPPNGGR